MPTHDTSKPRGDPLREYRVWSIGMARGPSPLDLHLIADNPVLTARDVTDVNALYVADPFMIRRDGVWYLYFEILPPGKPPHGVIGMASSRDAISWQYQGVVLREPFHLSYPQVFEWQGAVYMIPESLGAEAVRLYRATQFPRVFEPVADLLPGQWADPTLCYHQGRWWMFVCADPFKNRTLHLFFADRLRGPWHPHAQNPIIADDQRTARPGGRIRSIGGRPIRLAQDCIPRYGSRLRAFEIVELGQDRYHEVERPESPVLCPAPSGWNSLGMHHLDAHQLDDGSWIACVDGDTAENLPEDLHFKR